MADIAGAPQGRLRLVGGVQHVAGDTPPTSPTEAAARPMLLTPYAATALESDSATVAARHSRSGLSRRLTIGQRVVLVDRRGGLHDGLVEDIAYTDSDVVYLLGPEHRQRRRGTRLRPIVSAVGATTSPSPARPWRAASAFGQEGARVLDLELARRRRSVRGDGASR